MLFCTITYLERVGFGKFCWRNRMTYLRVSGMFVSVKGVISLLVILGLTTGYIATMMGFKLLGLAEIAMFSSANLP
ncbi:hypothetical protein SLEP1_g11476 [Rubroshorea leprosula]|uniref:Uncharacterized protein n=1 Tax=Rubroshorea leprosula TaxID=152421 RepID=A0AAV5IKN2_9ROSI|nr:hypothetical protein SLEP1_g11476 [Rubroshorea leprosula]